MSRLPLRAAEVLTVLIARELRDGDRVHIGANQAQVQTGVALAAAVYGLDIRMTAGGGHWFGDLDRATGKLVYNPDTVTEMDAPLDQERALDDMDRMPVVFASGLQIDRTGNVNLIGMGFRDGAWAVRGPGSAGLPSLTGLATTFYAYLASHSTRTFVETVEFVSAVGSPRRRAEFNLPTIERGAVLTPLGRFTWHGEYLALQSTAPGVGIDEIREHTSFDLEVADDCGVLPEATDDEIAFLKAGSA